MLRFKNSHLASWQIKRTVVNLKTHHVSKCTKARHIFQKIGHSDLRGYAPPNCRKWF